MPLDPAAIAQRHGIRPGTTDTVGRAAARLKTTARMLRYRESLGLVQPGRTGGNYRSYDATNLLALAVGAELEARYGVPPAALAFALRALEDDRIAAELRTLTQLTRRPVQSTLDALGFETRKAQRLLRLAG
jgi:MerR family transcriptional regulator, copper efflux regulator